jgi:hypothetical protein
MRTAASLLMLLFTAGCTSFGWRDGPPPGLYLQVGTAVESSDGRVSRLVSHAPAPFDLACDRFFVLTPENTLWRFNAQAMTVSRVPMDHPVKCVAMDRARNRVYIGGWAEEGAQIDCLDGDGYTRSVIRLNGFTAVEALAVSSAGDRLLAACSGRSAAGSRSLLIGVESGERLPFEFSTHFAFRDDTTWLATVRDGLRQFPSGESSEPVVIEGHWVSSISPLGDFAFLQSTGFPQRCHFARVTEGSPQLEALCNPTDHLGHGSLVLAGESAWSPDERTFAFVANSRSLTQDLQRSVRVLDVETCEMREVYLSPRRYVVVPEDSSVFWLPEPAGP